MAKSERRSKRECSKGHSMDPNWVNCPYCEAEDRAQQRSHRPDKAAAGRQATKVGDIPASPRRITKPMPGKPVADRPAPSNVGENRRIMGVLITYTWRPEGELFAVREGKNYIGRNQVSSEASHRNCDIMVSQDSRMSGEHALILCRHGIYEAIDLKAANGTFINGQMLKTNQSTELGNSAEIKTGDTLWSFFKIKGPGSGSRTAPPPIDSRPARVNKKHSDKDTHIP
jgi:hypothetical protein